MIDQYVLNKFDHLSNRFRVKLKVQLTASLTHRCGIFDYVCRIVSEHRIQSLH